MPRGQTGCDAAPCQPSIGRIYWSHAHLPYGCEAGGAAALQSYNDSITGLGSSFGGLGRLGIWLPLNFSAEVEGSLAKSNDVSVKVGTASLLYNLLLGSSTWGYLKAGIGGTKYGPGGDECQKPEWVGKICGTTTTFAA